MKTKSDSHLTKKGFLAKFEARAPTIHLTLSK